MNALIDVASTFPVMLFLFIILDCTLLEWLRNRYVRGKR